jgi:hypothetical protein
LARGPIRYRGPTDRPSIAAELAVVGAGRAACPISHARCQWLEVRSSRMTFLHDYGPIWEHLIDRMCHVDERSLRKDVA